MDGEAEPQIEIEPPAAGERGLLPGMRTMHIKGVDLSSDDDKKEEEEKHRCILSGDEGDGDAEADDGAADNRDERRIKLGAQRKLSPEEVKAARNRLKSAEKLSNENINLSDNFLSTGVDLGQSKFGDASLFYHNTLVNPDTLEVSKEANYNASREFMLNEFTFLRLSGIISSKNHIVVGLLYPRLQHLYSAKTQFSAGMAFGSLSKYIAGVSHAYSKSLAFAAEAQYCAHENKLYTNVCVKQQLSSSVSVSTSLLVNSAKESRKFFETKSSVVSISAVQNMKNIEEEEDEVPGTVHKSIFGDVVEKRRIGLSLGTSEAKVAVQQKTTFNCLNLSTILSLGATFKADKAHLDGTSLLKWRIPGIYGVCAYFGLRFSMDGTHLIVGLKVGTTKLFFPIVVLNTTHAQNLRE